MPEESDQQPQPQEDHRFTVERNESGLTPNQEARILKRAVKKQWNGSQRWPTRESFVSISERVKEQQDYATLVDVAALSAFSGLQSADERTRRIVEKTVVMMEAQNMHDDHHNEGEIVTHEHTILSADEKRSRLSAIAGRLGATGVVIEATATDAGSGTERANGASKNGSNGHNGHHRENGT